MDFKDVMDWVDAMLDHDHLILPNESVKRKVSFISEDGKVFSISHSDLKESIKQYPPNRECIVLAEKALNGDKDPLAEFLNASAEEEEDNEDEDEESEEDDFDENQFALSSKPSLEDLIENVDPVDKYTKDLLVRMSLMSADSLNEWKEKSTYGRLLYAVLNNDGPKGEWLKLVLDNIK